MSLGLRKLQKGDAFRMGYGSPKMTVVDIDGDGVNCRWLAGSREQTAWVSFACPMKIEKRGSRQKRRAGDALVSPKWVAGIRASLKQIVLSVRTPLYSLLTPRNLPEGETSNTVSKFSESRSTLASRADA